MARCLGPCRIAIVQKLGWPRGSSRWRITEQGLEITVASASREHHDIAMEVLVCLGQVLWTTLDEPQAKAWWLLLDREIIEGISGEIDEDALEQKQRLFASRHGAQSTGGLGRYGAASFAGTAAEYIHCLWHDVTVRSGADYLPPRQLQRRLRLLAEWFPPGPGFRLFPSGHESAHQC